MSDRIGRAVLELRTDSGAYFSDFAKVRQTARDLDRAWANAGKRISAGMSAAGRDASATTKIIAGMSASGREAITQLQKARSLSAQIASGMSGRGFTAPIREQRAELDALAKGMTAAGRAATPAARLIAGMGAAGREAAAGLRPLTQDTTLAQRAITSLRGSVVQMAGAFAIGNIVTGAVFGIVRLGREAFDSAGHILDLRNKTGLTTSTIQRMQFVANQTGTTIDAMTQSSFRLGIALSSGGTGVVSALRALRLTLAEVQRMNPSQQFEVIVGALSKVGNETERNRIGMALFGRQFSEIAAAVGEGYADIARHARVSSDAQLEALDRAADRWQQFVDNSTKNVEGFIGQQLLLHDAMRRVDDEARRQGRRLGSTERLNRAQQLIQQSLLPNQPSLFGTDARSALVTPPVPPPDYVARVNAARQALAGLSAAQREQLLAAQKTGAETEELTEIIERFGVKGVSARLVLSLLTDQTKQAEKATDKYADIVNKLTGATARSEATTLAHLLASGQINLARVTKEQQTEIADTLTKGVEAWRLLGLAVPASVQQQLAAVHQLRVLPDILAEIRRETEALAASQPYAFEGLGRADLDRLDAQSEALGRSAATQVSELQRQAQVGRQIVFRRAEHEIEMAKRAGAGWQQVADMERGLSRARLESAIADSRTQLEAEVADRRRTGALTEGEYQAMQASHAATVQQMREDWQLTEIAKRDELRRTHSVWLRTWASMQQAADQTLNAASSGLADYLLGLRSFRDTFVDIWRSIRQAVSNVLSGMLQDFIGGYLRRLVSSAAGASIGGGAGNTAAGLATSAGQMAGAAALPGLFGAGTGAAAGSTAAGAATLTYGAGAAPGVTTAGTAGAGGGALGFLANPGFWTNPITIGVAAGALLTWGIVKKGWGRGGWEGMEGNKRRDQFIGQFGDITALGNLLLQAFMGKGMTYASAETQRRALIDKQLNAADSENEFMAAQRNIARALAPRPVRTFHQGGMVGDAGPTSNAAQLHPGELLVKAQIGEGFLNRAATRLLGGAAGVRALNAGLVSPAFVAAANRVMGSGGGARIGSLSARPERSGAGPIVVNQIVNAEVKSWDAVDVERGFRKNIVPLMKRAFTLNTDDLAATVARSTGW